MKTKINKKEYMQIVGLLTLAEKHSRAIEEITDSLREITGEKEEWGHCGDAMLDDSCRNTDSLLKKLKIQKAFK